MHPKTRRSAIALLKSVYFTGKPCPKGHMSVRYTTNSSCRQCVREAASEQQQFVRQRFKAAQGGR